MIERIAPSREFLLAALILFQATCTSFFLVDIASDLRTLPVGTAIGLHMQLELFANIGLMMAIVVEGYFLRQFLRRQIRAERALSVAQGALHQLMQDHFEDWGLTAAECDVAAFTIKGFSISEVAALRQSAEGTVKSQLNAIYRKSGLSGRGQLVGFLIEDLLPGPPHKAHAGPKDEGLE